MDNSGDVVSLQDLCLLTVSDYLSPSNVWSIYRLVPYVHCKRIEHIVHSFICDNFMDISHTHQFLALDEKEIQWLVDNDEIVASEAAVFDGLARWYKHSKHQRENAFKQLFDRLHVSVIGRNVLWQMIKKYKLYKVIPDLNKYKLKMSKFPLRRFDLDKLIHEENIFNIMVFHKEDCIDNICKDDTCQFASFWVPFALNPDYPFYHQYVILNQQAHEYKLEHVLPFHDKFFVLGMMKRKGESDFVPVNIRLDFHLQTLTHCQAPLSNVLGVSGCLTVTCGIYIYFLGGFGHVEETDRFVLRNTVYRYDTVKDEWREMARMIHCRVKSSKSAGLADSTVVSYKNRYLYVFGTQFNEKYDIYTNTWIPVVSSSYLRRMCRISAFTMNDKIYVLDDYECEFLVFDPLADSWQEYVQDLSQKEPFRCLNCSPQECFGEYFSTFHDKAINCQIVWHLSALDESLREIKKKKLYSVKARNALVYSKPDIKIVNRRARVRLVDLFNAQTQDVVLVL